MGFGWTNAVVLEFLHLYGDRLEAEAGKRPDAEQKQQRKSVTSRQM